MVRRHLTGGKFGKRTAIVSALAWQAPAAFVVATKPSRLRAAATYAIQMWAYVAHYDMPDDDPTWMERRLKVQYPIRIDRLLGLGEIPTVRLQRTLGRKGTGASESTASSGFSTNIATAEKSIVIAD